MAGTIIWPFWLTVKAATDLGEWLWARLKILTELSLIIEVLVVKSFGMIQKIKWTMLVGLIMAISMLLTDQDQVPLDLLLVRQ